MDMRIPVAVILTTVASASFGAGLELAGSRVTPHVQSPNLRYRRPRHGGEHLPGRGTQRHAKAA